LSDFDTPFGALVLTIIKNIFKIVSYILIYKCMTTRNTGSQSGMGMSMRMDLSPRLEQRQLLSLELFDDDERGKIAWALELWETRPHTEMHFPVSVLSDALGIKSSQLTPLLPPTGGSGGSESNEREFSAEFVIVSAEEIRMLDPEEQCGVLLGNCIFVSDQVPEQYLPMVVANLGFLREIGGNDALKDVVKVAHLDMDVSRHWTANLLDILLANQNFADDPEERTNYLAWRKKLERTDFFNNSIIDEFLRQKNKYREFKRTVHPLQRSKMARLSWIFSGVLSSFGLNMVDRDARMMRVSKPDLIVRRLCDRYTDQFDANTMCEVIDFIMTNSQVGRKNAKTVRYVDFRGTALAGQAYLLTEDVVGQMASVLEPTTSQNIYIVKPQAARTLEALKDRIAYFTRQGLLNSGINRNMLAFVKSVSRTLDQGGAERLRLELGSGEEAQQIAERVTEIEAKIAQIDHACEGFIKLRADFNTMVSVEYLPGELEANYRKLLLLRDQLQVEMTELTGAQSSLRGVEKVLQEQRALIEALVA
jgi:hypothetical protein